MKVSVKDAINIITSKVEHWYEKAVALLPNLALAIVVFLLFYVLAKLVKKYAGSLLGKVSQRRALNDLFTSILYFAVLAVGAIIILWLLGLTEIIATLLAGVGILGLALGFAFQDITANFISGILIVLRRPFEVGDIIESKDQVGSVTNINLTLTTIRTFQGLEVLIPNKQVYQEVVTNYTHTPERRIDLAVGVSYGDDLRKVKDLTIKAVESVSSIDQSKGVTLFFDEFGDSSINFKIRFWGKSASQPDFLAAKSDAIVAIKEAYDQNDIMIPFPIRTLDFGIKGGEKLSELPIYQQNGEK